MDNFVDERDYELLSRDKYTFSVLSRIIGGENTLLLSDHERMIVCFTGQPYPVWIWMPDDASEEEMERAYRLAGEHGFLDGEHRFNVKYELAEYFIARAKEDGPTLSIVTNLFAYDCPDPVMPSDETDGVIHQCTAEDLDELVDFFEMFHDAVGIDKESREQYRLSAEEGVKKGELYFWRNAAGRSVASCSWHPVNDMASIGLVYTREEERRKHYAEHLVYQVTVMVKEAGYLPMLYTDADYVASNACYEKIGYILRGKLCTVA
ncbi:GNAT family N-acetyltransferase [Butyrivibrio sp. AE2032]|uniref:GNAT family N-acetyltransferase n=1 Tax=Butyrivibrio sp. AE2032 TaxID=1458463 RepID=UPI000550CB8F|nr:GNAT family N-acetyltransferase [Butyrivibrio sp. AE2032]